MKQLTLLLELSDAAKQAHKMGLKYQGHGRWGKEGREPTHKTDKGKLVRIPKRTPKKDSDASISGPFGNITAKRLGALSKATNQSLGQELGDFAKDMWHKARGREVDRDRPRRVQQWKAIDNIQDAENAVRDHFHYQYPKGVIDGKKKAELKYMLSKNKLLKKAFKDLVGDYIHQDKDGNWVWPEMQDNR